MTCGNKSAKRGRDIALPGNWSGHTGHAQSRAGSFSLQRGKPRDSQKIADLITRLSKGKHTMTKDEVMEAFGEKAFLLLQMDNELVGIAGWQVENLVARTTDLYLDPRAAADQGLPLIIAEVERASSDLQCEASLVFPPMDLVGFDQFGNSLAMNAALRKCLACRPGQMPRTNPCPKGRLSSSNNFAPTVSSDRSRMCKYSL